MFFGVGPVLGLRADLGTVIVVGLRRGGVTFSCRFTGRNTCRCGACCSRGFERATLGRRFLGLNKIVKLVCNLSCNCANIKDIINSSL